MGLENPRKIVEETEQESLERGIVESLVELTKAGKINWEFSMFGTRAEYKGITYFSEDVQDAGPIFIVSRRIEGETDSLGLPKYERIARFSPQPAYFMRDFLYYEVCSKLPEVIEKRRRDEEGPAEEEREEATREQAARRQRLGEINEQLRRI